MPAFGGFTPFPLRFGGGRPRLQTLYESLNQALGSGYDTDDASTVTAETMAEARAIDGLYSGNVRMSYIMDPARCPEEIIPRLEFICGLHPHRTDTIPARRRALSAHFLLLSGNAILEDVVVAIAGDSFIAIQFTALADAIPRWVITGFPNNWTSNTAHIVVRVRQTGLQTTADFWNMRATLRKFLRLFLPVWVTFDIAIRSSHDDDCFYLDEPDLDLETFCA